MASNLDQILETFYQQLTKAVEDAKNAEQWSQEQLDAANQEITDFRNLIGQLKQLTQQAKFSLVYWLSTAFGAG